VGVVGYRGAAGQMTKRINFVEVLYVVLLGAVAVSVWAFFQADQQHQQTSQVLQETYEIQWRAAQIRERLTGVMTELQIALATGKKLPRINRDVRHLAHNVRQTVSLEYIGRYLGGQDIGRLTNALEVIETAVVPATQEANKNYSKALTQLTDLRSDMFRVSNAALEHMTAYSDAARTEERNRRLGFVLVMGLATIVLIAVGSAWQSRFVRWKEQHLRSFSSLFAHTTTSHISALRLFLDEVKEGEAPDKHMIDQAQAAARDLERMNTRLRDIIMAYEQPKGTLGSQLKSLSALLSGIAGTVERNDILKLDVTYEALDARVPASQLHVILSELVRNAEAAMEGREFPQIHIRARVHKPLIGSKRLIMSVEDNGNGMTENVKKNATMPFFSTRGGNHTGMGLASIVDLVRCMKGKLRLNSAAGRGTSVQFDFPLG
jgi:signal transduction histidine kinase